MNQKILLVILGVMALAAAMKMSHKGSSGFYKFDETPKGHQCSNHDQCDGARTCSQYGWCQGVARPVKSAAYYYPAGPRDAKCPSSSSSLDYALKDYYCDGEMTCEVGVCIGLARQPKDGTYVYDESLTSVRCPSNQTDPSYPIRDHFCTGMRTCSAWGWCQGEARSPKSATYYFNETRTTSICSDFFSSTSTSIPSDYYCDGNRKCVNRICDGVARPLKGANYNYDESVTSIRCPLNPLGPNYPTRDYFCDGARTCSAWGWCQGTAR